MMLWNCLFPAVFPAWRSLFLSLPGPGGAAREVSGCLSVLRGQGQWVAVPGQPKDGAGAAVVPPSAPSWQLLLNLPFIACQKRPGWFSPPPLAFNPDFHHSPGCALPSPPCWASPSGAQALPGVSALPPTPNILCAARGGRAMG